MLQRGASCRHAHQCVSAYIRVPVLSVHLPCFVFCQSSIYLCTSLLVHICLLSVNHLSMPLYLSSMLVIYVLSVCTYLFVNHINNATSKLFISLYTHEHTHTQKS